MEKTAEKDLKAQENIKNDKLSEEDANKVVGDAIQSRLEYTAEVKPFKDGIHS